MRMTIPKIHWESRKTGILFDDVKEGMLVYFEPTHKFYTVVKIRKMEIVVER